MAMTLNQLVLRSMRKNIKSYYLYVFALVFSVSLYYSFVTLQYNPAIVNEIGTGRSSAALKAASYLLLFIVTFFVLYANKLFMNRRSKEIGLYQLVGMSKSLVARLIAIENIILWFSAIVIGVLVGLLTSRIFVMILLKIVEKDVFVELSFSMEALMVTVVVFSVLLLIVILQTAIRIKRVTLLALITTTAVADERVKKFNAFQMFLGFVGLISIGYGYYLSTTLLDLDNLPSANILLFKMVSILALTVGGTYFVFRFSVALILNLIRKSKKGLLSIQDVLSLSTIMHRMKANAMSLTTITVLSATTLAILTLTYISYYSTDSVANQAVPYDFIMYEDTGFEMVGEFDKEGIQYTRYDIDILAVPSDVRTLLIKKAALDKTLSTELGVQVVSLKAIQKKLPNLQLQEEEGYIIGYDSLSAENIRIEGQKPIQFNTSTGKGEIFIKEVIEDRLIPDYHYFGFFTVVVSDTYFQKLLNDPLTKNQKIVGMDLKEENQLIKAQEVFEANKVSVEMPIPGNDRATNTVSVQSQEDYRINMLDSLGMTIFISGFLGLAFLIATGSILYFKQMSEADEEKGTYKILRKMGFTTNEIMRGIRRKQLFNFGFPLIIGLAHSYFAVKSGWILFGTELVAPLLITMGIYIVLYSIFAILSAGYYRKVVEAAL
ncbi:bacitracin transport system permease protein [Psychrobacillus psychrotolerans]|uniref:Bacitracin transport system permease protein n=3 Tax=Psychrobacillus psychrotolerans TaxID=126156 RepID=A0A1I6AAG8_9BACI|nr:bacitracin transport system permease protein [Psychrobacillus psychrotolerans]